jgi:hydrogenase maturation protein HypF
MAYIYLREAFGERADAIAPDLLPSLEVGETKIVSQLIEKGINSPLTSGMGRLFDAASAILGVCDVNTYHSQAPMELEAEASKEGEEDGHYLAAIFRDKSGALVIRGSDIIRGLVDDFTRGTSVETCAARFHNSVAGATLDMVKKIRDDTKLSIVALSGGVFANKFLTERVVSILYKEGFEVLLNEDVPAGDGGISLGQAAIAAWRKDDI